MRDRTCPVIRAAIRWMGDRPNAALLALLGQLTDLALPGEQALLMCVFWGWASMLHEIGISISHSGYHKTGPMYGNADMPGLRKRIRS